MYVCFTAFSPLRFTPHDHHVTPPSRFTRHRRSTRWKPDGFHVPPPRWYRDVHTAWHGETSPSFRGLLWKNNQRRESQRQVVVVGLISEYMLLWILIFCILKIHEQIHEKYMEDTHESNSWISQCIHRWRINLFARQSIDRYMLGLVLNNASLHLRLT